MNKILFNSKIEEVSKFIINLEQMYNKNRRGLLWPVLKEKQEHKVEGEVKANLKVQINLKVPAVEKVPVEIKEPAEQIVQTEVL